MRRHLVALDGKKQGDYAFEWYLENVNREGDQVVIFHSSTFELNVGLPGAAANIDLISKKVKEATAAADAITGKANQILKTRGIKGYVIVKSGMKPEEAILETVEQEKVDHIFMGTRDLHGFQRALVGSVSTAVARSAKVPVTIVKMTT